MIKKVMMAALLAACGADAGQPAQVTRQQFDEVNTLRRAAGLGPVERSPRADHAAMRHATDLARTGGTGHRGSDGSTHTARLGAAGCHGGVENVAWNMGTTHDAFAAWMRSEGHRRNILRPGARVYGLAQVGDRWVLVLADGC